MGEQALRNTEMSLRRRTTYFFAKELETPTASVIDQYSNVNTQANWNEDINPEEIPPDDLVDLTSDDLEIISESLEQRYHMNEFFTAIQNRVLISLNPLAEIPLFNKQFIDSYANADMDHAHERYPPHPYEICERAWRSLINEATDQFIVITGESGSGKSRQLQIIYDYLATRASEIFVRDQNLGCSAANSQNSRWRFLIESASFVINAFSSSKTILNFDSTRCVKLVSFQLAPNGTIRGINFRQGLLEKSRLVQRPRNERNFHIFYYLMAGISDETFESLGLSSNIADHSLLWSSEDTDDPLYPSDQSKYKLLREHFTSLGLKDEDFDQVLNFLAATIHLGNLDFNNLASDECIWALHYSSILLGFETDDLLEFLTDSEASRNTCPQELCYSMIKIIYENVVAFIVGKVNEALGASSMDVRTINILDTFGFEILPENGFEQFCINFVNECVHFYCNQSIFDSTVEDFMEDGVMVPKLDYFDNNACMNFLFGRSYKDLKNIQMDGKFGEKLNVQSKKGINGSDKELWKNLEIALANDEVYYHIKDPSKMSFGIRHYAADVEYRLGDFFVENSSIFDNYSKDFLRKSQDDFLRGIADKAMVDQNLTGNSRLESLAGYLRDLFSSFNWANSWFIRCIKPNYSGNPGKSDHEFIISQLEYLSCSQMVGLYRSGYFVSFTYIDFYRRYDVIQYSKKALLQRRMKGKEFRKTMTDLQPKCLDILQFAIDRFPDISFDINPYQIGLSRLYLTVSGHTLLEYLLNEKRDFWAREIQRVWRGFRDRCFVKNHQVHRAATLIQREFRGWIFLKKFSFLFYEDQMADEDLEKLIKYKTLVNWINEALDLSIELQEPDNLHFVENYVFAILKDGLILLDLAKFLFKNVSSLEELVIDSHDPIQVISVFLELCLEKNELEECEIFEAEDLLYHKNVEKVLNCLWKLYLSRGKYNESRTDLSVEHSLDSSSGEDLSQRYPIIKKFIENEKGYLIVLQTAVNFRRMLKSRRVMNKTEIRLLFQNILAIYNIHQEIIQAVDMYKVYSRDDANEESVGSIPLGSIIDNMFEKLKTEYQIYMKHVVDSHIFLTRIDKTQRNYLLTFRNSEHLGNGEPLTSFLTAPLTRFEDYMEFMRDLRDVTSSRNADLKYLEKTCRALLDPIKLSQKAQNKLVEIHDTPSSKDSYTVFDERLPGRVLNTSDNWPSSRISNSKLTHGKSFNKSSSNTRFLLNMESLVTSNRSFICKGSAWEVINSSLVKERCLFLFNDCLMIAKEVRGYNDAPKFQLKTVIALENTDLKISRNEDPHTLLQDMPVMRKAAIKFDSNPESGLEYLLGKNIIVQTPSSIAEFLYRTVSLNRHGVARFMTAPENEQVLVSYLKCFDFADLRIDNALRIFLSTIRPPGDAQAMDLVLDKFSERYSKDNPTEISSPKLALKLVFGLLMLNADWHRNTGDDENGHQNLSEHEFIERWRKHDLNCEIPDITLQGMYYSIVADKLAVAPPNEEMEASKISFSYTSIPFRLTVREDECACSITIPKPDAGLEIRIFAQSGLECSPSVLNFKSSNTAEFRLRGTNVGRKALYFLKLGRNSANYCSLSLPFGKVVIVEPPFMRHVFQIRSKFRDSRTKRKLTYMFSVADENQRKNWIGQIQNVKRALDKNGQLQYGFPLTEDQGRNVMKSFELVPNGAIVVPSDEGFDLCE